MDADPRMSSIVRIGNNVPRRRSAHAESIRAAPVATDGFISAPALRDLVLARGVRVTADGLQATDGTPGVRGG